MSRNRWTNLVTLQPPYDLLSHPAVLTVIATLAICDFVGDKIPAADHALHVVGLVVHPAAGALVALAADSSAGEVHPVTHQATSPARRGPLSPPRQP
jgi:hypothetical protein